jgi:hypothetical protein
MQPTAAGTKPAARLPQLIPADGRNYDKTGYNG